MAGVCGEWSMLKQRAGNFETELESGCSPFDDIERQLKRPERGVHSLASHPQQPSEPRLDFGP